MTIYKTDEEVLAIVQGFENRTISKREWTHAAHLTVGVYYCLNMPFALARNIMRDGIYWLNDHHGVPNNESSGYHETLTVFWLKRIWNFIDSRNGNGSLVEIANEVIAANSDPGIPFRYYTRELLFSKAAREEYVRPDIRDRYSKPLCSYMTILPI